MPQTSQIEPPSDPRWLNFLLAQEHASIFYHPSWLRTLSATYDFEPVCLAATSDDRIVGILPLMIIKSWITGTRAICLPLTDQCAPLVHDADTLNTLLDTAVKLCRERRCSYIEIRGLMQDSRFYGSRLFVSHKLELEQNPFVLFNRFSRTHLQHIRKTSTNGIRVERRTDLKAMREFIRLNTLTRRKHGVPPQPGRFFLNLYTNVISAGLGFVSLAVRGKVTLAASLFMQFAETLTYKYAASDPRFAALNPNYAIAWDAIQWGCEQRYAILDFGRSDLDNPGLLQYKRGWSPRETQLQYHKILLAEGAKKSGFDKYTQKIKPLIRYTPTPLLELLGKTLYRHVG